MLRIAGAFSLALALFVAGCSSSPEPSIFFSSGIEDFRLGCVLATPVFPPVLDEGPLATTVEAWLEDQPQAQQLLDSAAVHLREWERSIRTDDAHDEEIRSIASDLAFWAEEAGVGVEEQWLYLTRPDEYEFEGTYLVGFDRATRSCTLLVSLTSDALNWYYP